jgi:hypothetical protein
MVRKQLYIERHQDDALKRRAREQGVTEAEVIRAALERHERTERAAFRPDPRAWEEFTSLLRRLRKRKPLPRGGRRWTRNELYDDRVERQGRRAD